MEKGEDGGVGVGVDRMGDGLGGGRRGVLGEGIGGERQVWRGEVGVGGMGEERKFVVVVVGVGFE